MHKSINTTLLAMAALGLLSSSLSAAPQSRVKERGELTVTATLAPPPTAPVGPSGTADIVVTKPKFKSVETAILKISVTGLASGTYSIAAVLKDASTLALGEIVVDTTVPPGPTPEPPVEIPLAAGFDVSTVAKITVSDATPTVVLEGAVVPGETNWKFIANVQITGPDVVDPTAPKGKKVRGHVVAHSFIKDSVETKRGFNFVGFGAPGDTELTINVDGVVVGTVLSNKQGKVHFQEMPEPVVIRDIKLVTITDASGLVVMQAAF